MRCLTIDQSRSPLTTSEVHRGCHGSHAVVTMTRQTTMLTGVPCEDVCLAARSATGPVASSNIVRSSSDAWTMCRTEELVPE